MRQNDKFHIFPDDVFTGNNTIWTITLFFFVDFILRLNIIPGNKRRLPSVTFHGVQEKRHRIINRFHTKSTECHPTQHKKHWCWGNFLKSSSKWFQFNIWNFDCEWVVKAYLYFQKRDLERIVGINTHYIGALDFNLDKADKQFLISVSPAKWLL